MRERSKVERTVVVRASLAVAAVFILALGGMLTLALVLPGDAVGADRGVAALQALGAQIVAGLAGCAILREGALRASFAGAPRAMDVVLALPVGLGAFVAADAWVSLLAGAFADANRLAPIDSLSAGVIFATIVGAPLVEEWVGRGVLWRALERLTSDKGRIVATATLFSVSHGLNGGFVLEFPHRFLGGLALGWIRLRSGSLLPGILAHAIWNGTAVLSES